MSENEIPQLTTDLEIDDLGLSSVQTLELLAYIEESADVSLSQHALMTVETIADLAALVSSTMSETS
ncbi:phosphopantetheine-binding protein [Mycobacterium montefiorense]|uniref:phosphopantetheine-binding protein n=1 Tax=Mycobacterium montefiorense TaxID=154654 RepID=UPI0021F30220|nr:phosphopantetheine-binding protein [Mycobacterium montefiorense]MCV7429341.1 acyl carrier protein [Mycobacterium montefiorense]